jgi:predicted lipoprotein with Yx(FWY)xxD motif
MRKEKSMVRTMRRQIAIACAVIAAVAIAAGGGAAASAPAAKGTVVAVSRGVFGPMLVVGSGKYAGYTLYMITSDHASTYGCTTKLQNILGQMGACAGKSNDKKAEWPAITSVGSPVAGPGVSQKLLGTVSRPGIGEQITYAGHPLYLFDMGPGQITGEGWDEPTLPPWHGLWWLVSPAGSPLASPGTLTTTTVAGKTVLAALMETGAGWFAFPVYAYSKDTKGASACAGACALAWPAVLTTGTPGLQGALSAAKVGKIMRGDGTDQISYDGKPLYLYSRESIKPGPTGFAVLGNGAGKSADGGTFALVTP